MKAGKNEGPRVKGSVEKAKVLAGTGNDQIGEYNVKLGNA